MKKELTDLDLSFERIISIENIRLAYFDFIRKIDEDVKARRYSGIDGLTPNNIDFDSEKLFIQVRKEMLDFTEISPAYLLAIAKKNGGLRKIYVYTVKERIKAEAIYRVLEPYFDSIFSDFLFSYRTSHPSYYAIRSTVRRYKRFLGENYVFVTDITDYTDSINHKILDEKIDKLNLEENVKRLLKLFIKVEVFEKGKMVVNDFGIITGTPLCGMFANLFLNEFDTWAGKSIAFYRRVGDDVIAMDKSREKIENVRKRFLEFSKDLKLNINNRKSIIIKDTETFKFLGYQFKNGRIGFDDGSIKNFEDSFIQNFRRNSDRNIFSKISKIKKLNIKKVGGPDYEFGRLLVQKNLVDDTEQIRNFSGKLIGDISSYLFGKNNLGKRRKTVSILRRLGIRPLFKQYQNMLFNLNLKKK